MCADLDALITALYVTVDDLLAPAADLAGARAPATPKSSVWP